MSKTSIPAKKIVISEHAPEPSMQSPWLRHAQQISKSEKKYFLAPLPNPGDAPV